MFTLEWRRVTAEKRNPAEVNILRHLSESELLTELKATLPIACWAYIEDEKANKFAGQEFQS